MNLKIKDVLNCTNGKLIIGNENIECINFERDSRNVKKGSTYIGLKGENVDGSIFWKNAFDNGAEIAIINNIEISKEDLEKYQDKNLIIVEDTRKALIEIATAKRNLYKDLILVGVTGSVGKTSTKDIIANVLSQKYKTLKTEGNNNNDIGLPFTILRLKDEEAAVIEMGMNHLGEISLLTKIARPTLSVITNVGTSHIGNLGSRENILKAKLEILEGMESPKLIINNDNDLLNEWNKSSKIEVHTFGIENNSECMATKINKKENSSEFICNLNNKKFKINVPVGGDAFILNALCASMVGNLLNLTENQIIDGISSFELTKKRMEIIPIKNNIILINDSYNASFDSMKSAIEYLGNNNANRKIAVLGDMFELGDFSQELHRNVGKEVAQNNIDILITIGNDAKFIKEEAENNGFNKNNSFYFINKEDALIKIKEIISSGDIVLFKASNGMKLFEMVEELKIN